MTSELIYIILFAGVVLFGSSVFLFRFSNSTLKLILSFSGAYLLAIAILHLIPEVYSYATTYTGIFILAGFLLQILIEFFSEGIEHGHMHIHAHEEKTFPVTVMLALAVHSFIEGMPLSGDINETKKTLAAGIFLHNIPISIALTSMLVQSGIKKANVILWLVLFAFMTPAGALAGTILESTGGFITQYSNYTMAIVVGVFLHVSTTILFESSEQHRFNVMKLLTILAGMGLAIVFI